MKIVINKCFGGFSLSMKAVKRMSEIKGRPCYFFKTERIHGDYIPITENDKPGELGIFYAFDVPNPNESLKHLQGEKWNEASMDDRRRMNDEYSAHCLDSRNIQRNDPALIQAVEELGEYANGTCAQLEIVEIPDDVDWKIDEYDGRESIHEKHRVWY